MLLKLLDYVSQNILPSTPEPKSRKSESRRVREVKGKNVGGAGSGGERYLGIVLLWYFLPLLDLLRKKYIFRHIFRAVLLLRRRLVNHISTLLKPISPLPVSTKRHQYTPRQAWGRGMGRNHRSVWQFHPTIYLERFQVSLLIQLKNKAWWHEYQHTTMFSIDQILLVLHH